MQERKFDIWQGRCQIRKHYKKTGKTVYNVKATITEDTAVASMQAPSDVATIAVQNL